MLPFASLKTNIKINNILYFKIGILNEEADIALIQPSFIPQLKNSERECMSSADGLLKSRRRMLRCKLFIFKQHIARKMQKRFQGVY